MYTYSFEKLEVWNDAKEFTKSIYRITSTFPDSEKYGLSSQIRRASISICSNIAEGSTRKTNKDKAHFTTLAFGSAVEVLNQLIICNEIDLISKEDYIECRAKLESIELVLSFLIQPKNMDFVPG